MSSPALDLFHREELNFFRDVTATFGNTAVAGAELLSDHQGELSHSLSGATLRLDTLTSSDATATCARRTLPSPSQVDF